MKKFRTLAATALVAGVLAVSAIPANAAPGTFTNGSCTYRGVLANSYAATYDYNGRCGVLGIQGVLNPAGTSTTVYTSWKYGAKSSASVRYDSPYFNNSYHSGNTL